MGTLIAIAGISALCFAAAWWLAKWFPYDDIHWHMEAQRLGCNCKCPCHRTHGSFLP